MKQKCIKTESARYKHEISSPVPQKSMYEEYVSKPDPNDEQMEELELGVACLFDSYDDDDLSEEYLG